MSVTRFNIPASPRVNKMTLGNFKGVDFANNATQVKPSRSPNGVNMVSDLAGKPVKRCGYRLVAGLGGRINGVFRLATDTFERVLVHAGTRLYELGVKNGIFASEGVLLREGLGDERSFGFQKNERLWILDGKRYLVYGEFDGAFGVKAVEDVAYVPRTCLNKNPDGSAGVSFEGVNLLSRKRINCFLGKASETVYKLDSDGIDASAVSARKLSGAVWVNLVEVTDFTVDRALGRVTFKVAPGVSPVSGRDNVEITFAKSVAENLERINGCRFGAMYGVNGETDRVFVSGNGKYPNLDWWSGLNDPSYFSDLCYGILGQDSSAIMGYSRVGNSLAIHKESNEQDQTIFLRNGVLSNGVATFPIVSGIAGVGAMSRYAFGTLGTEPFFLSNQGVYAVTNQDFSTERYAQVRSYYVNPRLIGEKGLDEAVAVVHEGYYYLGVNNRVYVADSRQKEYEKNAPQSSFQYEWYYFEELPVRVWWVYDGRLFFGTAEGELMVMSLSAEHSATLNGYSDNGRAIRAIWDTPFFTFDELSRYKTLRGFWLMLSPYIRSSVTIYYRVKGELRAVKHSTVDIFDFNDLDFERFSFNTDDSPVIIPTNTKAKKFMLIQFRLENDVLGEGFGFYEMEAQFVVQGRYKG